MNELFILLQDYHDLVVKVTRETKLYAPVQHKVRDIANKMALLDREVKYLVNKAKIWRPKVEAPSVPETAENKTETEGNKTESKTADEEKENKAEKDDSATVETEETLELPSQSDSTPSEDEKTEKHSEL